MDPVENPRGSVLNPVSGASEEHRLSTEAVLQLAYAGTLAGARGPAHPPLCLRGPCTQEPKQMLHRVANIPSWGGSCGAMLTGKVITKQKEFFSKSPAPEVGCDGTVTRLLRFTLRLPAHTLPLHTFLSSCRCTHAFPPHVVMTAVFSFQEEPTHTRNPNLLTRQ